MNILKWILRLIFSPVILTWWILGQFIKIGFWACNYDISEISDDVINFLSLGYLKKYFTIN